jgi:hAT family C-terminal dimerisation region
VQLIRWQEILVPFRELCEQEEGRAQKLGQEGPYGALWRVLHGMNFMSHVLEKARGEVNEPQADPMQTNHYNAGINTAWLKLEKYFKLVNCSPLYTAAIALHPAWRFEYFEDKWMKHPNRIQTAKKTFRNLFLKYSSAVESTYNIQSQSSESKSSYLAYDEFSADYLSRRYQKQRSLELHNYLKSFDYRLVGMRDPLNWWKEHKTDYPILARMAFDIFSIPAMSSEIERVFSSAKKLVTDERNCLGSEVVEACETQRHWLNADLVN